MTLSFLRRVNVLGCRSIIRNGILFTLLSSVLCLLALVLLGLVSVQTLKLQLLTVDQETRDVRQHSARQTVNVSDSVSGEEKIRPHVHLQSANVTDSIDNKREFVTVDTVDVENTIPRRVSNLHPKQYHKDEVHMPASSWTKEMTEEERAVMGERRNMVKKVCGSLKLQGVLAPDMKKIYNNLLFVNEYKMVWCPIFKAASTSWVKNLLLLAGKKKVDSGVHPLSRKIYAQPTDPAERERHLKNSMKMMIVRHPLERILSAYRDKMLRVRNPKGKFETMQKKIARGYVDLSTNTSATNLTQPTFTQFLLKVKDDIKKAWKSGDNKINMHWRPFWLTCAPCHLTYDVIAHVETLNMDQEFIIRELGLQDHLLNLYTHASNFDVYNKTSEATRHYYSQVPLSLLKDIVNYYRYDFNLYGYSPDPYFELARAD
ncbi:carbohydrate sulfotransferase 10-like [Homarus americanus]|uniref:carbohydrate sulfotransferase 10-like n=1 Tax=Homarus americanus TaxID=6706 RepID=UPI001C491FFA|nr:carbohydrate sulfotransferase 10-like [Homarus americanus]